MKYIGILALALIVAGCSVPTTQTSPNSNRARTIAAELRMNTAIVGASHKSTPFNDYDSELVDSITKRWYVLLGSGKFNFPKRGKVVVQFRLHPDGTVSDVKITKNQVGELLGSICERAIKDPAPFKQWPPDMEKMVGADYREITFTFYYR